MTKSEELDSIKELIINLIYSFYIGLPDSRDSALITTLQILEDGDREAGATFKPIHPWPQHAFHSGMVYAVASKNYGLTLSLSRFKQEHFLILLKIGYIEIAPGFDRDGILTKIVLSKDSLLGFDTFFQLTPKGIDYAKSAKSAKKDTANPTALEVIDIRFDPVESRLIIGGLSCRIPHYKNEYYICELLFKKEKGNWMEWQDAHARMTGLSSEDYADKTKNKAYKRAVYDTIQSLNRKVKNACRTNKTVFFMRNGEIMREF